MNVRPANNLSTPALGFLALIIFSATNVIAAPGNLDLTFGNGGKVTDWPGSGSAQAMAIQSDGKIVVAAGYRSAPGNRDFRVARYNADGSTDTSFGGGTGRVTTDFGGFDDSWSVAIQPDGKIVVIGTSQLSATQGGLALARYNPDGSLDPEFGGGSGKILTAAPCWYAYYGAAADVAIQTDGNIVGVTGFTDFDDVCESDGLLIRYRSDGSLDPSFGNGGAVLTQYPLWFVDLQPGDGKIIAGPRDRMARFNPNGSLDTGFGSAGIVTIPTGFHTSGHTLAFSSDGKIMAAGSRQGSAAYMFALFRFNQNGSLDASFDGDGIVITPIGSGDAFGSSLVIQPDAKIVAAGTSVNSVTHSDFALVRYHQDGSLDTSFGGGDGISTVDFDNSSGDSASDVALDSQGRAVVAGETGDKLAIACFRLTGRRAAIDFDGDGRSDLSVFRPSDGVWYLNRWTNGIAATQFGLPTDKITPADFDGDGETDIAVFRDGFWYWLNSSNGVFQSVQWGLSSDLPVPADFTGDGRSELTVYRGGIWWSLDLTLNRVATLPFGLPTDKPVVADYDGDGRADWAVYRNGVWHLNRSSLGYIAISFGLTTDKPVPADYDGDGRVDPAVYRDGTWYLLQSTNGFTAFQFGLATDIPAPADYDGDGKTDLAVFRDGTWHLWQSTNGSAAVRFGLTGDRPVPSAFLQ